MSRFTRYNRYRRGGMGHYYWHSLLQLGLVRHCAHCGAEFMIRAEGHYFCSSGCCNRDHYRLQQARKRIRELDHEAGFRPDP
jgi:hypothetical protein